MEMLKIFSDFTNELNKILPLPDGIESLLDIHFYLSEEDLLLGVLKFTIPELRGYRENSDEFKQQCLDGTVSYCEDKFHIHFLKNERNVTLTGYTYIHELIHVYNQLKYYACPNNKSVLLELNPNKLLHLWDEYSARYYSSVVFLEYYIKQGVSHREDYEQVINAFIKQISDDNFESYSGSQYLGFVAALFDTKIIIESDLMELLNQGNAKSVFDTYRNIKDICSIE